MTTDHSGEQNQKNSAKTAGSATTQTEAFDKHASSSRSARLNVDLASNSSAIGKPSVIGKAALAENSTVIQQCVEAELRRYFALLDGQPPHDLYRMVMSQVEKSLLKFVLEEVGNNQSRASEYLGISRGTLRSRISEHED